MENHLLVTRFHYQEHDPRFEWRFSYYQALVLPKLLSQTDQNFDIGIWCYPHHRERFEKLHKKIRTFTVKKTEELYKKIHRKSYYYDFTNWENIEGLPKYKIQSGLDSDDFVAKDYIETIHKAFTCCSRKTHISFQPEIFNLDTLQKTPIGNAYNSAKGSAFMSLFQPDENDYHFVYDRSHLILGEVAKKSITLPKGKCWATVHHLNESTGK